MSVVFPTVQLCGGFDKRIVVMKQGKEKDFVTHFTLIVAHAYVWCRSQYFAT